MIVIFVTWSGRAPPVADAHLQPRGGCRTGPFGPGHVPRRTADQGNRLAQGHGREPPGHSPFPRLAVRSTRALGELDCVAVRLLLHAAVAREFFRSRQTEAI